MGIWEKPRPDFLDALEREFGMPMPREHGHDVVDAIRAMRDGKAHVFFALGGNFVSAVSDTEVTDARPATYPPDRAGLDQAQPLPRRHRRAGADPADPGPHRDRHAGQRDAVRQRRGHRLRGARLARPARAGVGDLRSEVAIVCHARRAHVSATATPADWQAFDRRLRQHPRPHLPRRSRAATTTTHRIRQKGGFVLPHGPRDSRTFPTESGLCEITVNELEWPRVPDGRLLLQTVRSHDQFNTTIYGLDDRYRGIHRGRRVVFVNADDLAELGFADGDDGRPALGVVRRRRPACRRASASWPTRSREAARPRTSRRPTRWSPLDSQADRSGTPTSKAVVVRLEPSPNQTG